ncbi:MAG TPA: 50S ribosomal protein L24 [Syntrophales bacterium]|nr:50S ribosomal protein L24 [Syntrophales bacterium]HON22762.1 50S ribosomal protein L24 [Syntrophales bacterium]HOU78550.1 50S ribosomal protein L24 [Syntrophales bacterium]HPC32173.1 50S ribosomal protein L24 [Syntrophales bacterium]HQG33925.1 50S ribosomal protein L24 [Syntrophales bacterium]
MKKGDMVQVTAGREKGKTGKIIRIMRDKERVIVEKLNFVKRHQRPDAKGKGGIVEKEGPINITNVSYFCSKCEKGVRLGHKILEEGKKVRICRKCQEIIDA